MMRSFDSMARERTRARSLLWSAMLGLAAACGADEARVIPTTPEPLDGQECAACGMIVRDEPSPRAQIVHADGTRAFFCSLADLVAYQEVPSRHGALVHTWVETLPADLDPALHDVGLRPWSPAADAHYVLGLERRVMGTPALAYEREADASAVATRVSGRAMRWNEAMRALARHP
jgi:copper chaperone NosL